MKNKCWPRPVTIICMHWAYCMNTRMKPGMPIRTTTRIRMKPDMNTRTPIYTTTSIHMKLGMTIRISIHMTMRSRMNTVMKQLSMRASTVAW